MPYTVPRLRGCVVTLSAISGTRVDPQRVCPPSPARAPAAGQTPSLWVPAHASGPGRTTVHASRVVRDLVVFGGDVAAGPMPVETIEVLAGYGGRARFLRGNADRFMVEIFDGDRAAGEASDAWPANLLSRDQRDFLSSFEPVVEVDVDGLGWVLCCHAGPASDEAPIITPATPDEVIAKTLASTEASLVVAGHTHTQFDRRVASRRMVNAGSVGMPYADQPGAYWVLLGPEVDLRRTAYDLKGRPRRSAGPTSPPARSWLEVSSDHRRPTRRSPCSSAWPAGRAERRLLERRALAHTREGCRPAV